MLRLCQVWAGLTGRGDGWESWLSPVQAQSAISGVVIDSREVHPGDLFVALKGERTDGHLFLGEALARGAAAAIAGHQAATLGLDATLVSDDSVSGHRRGAPVIFLVPDTVAGLQRLAAYWRAQMPVVVVGVTGSVGKTTTKELIGDVLAQHYVTLRNVGNLNNEIGLPLTLLSLGPEHQRAVLEMGMYAPGEIARLCTISRPKIGVVTNVGPTHLLRLGSIEGIARAKAELVQALPPHSEGGMAILNADDPLVAAMAGSTQARVFTYGLDSRSDLWADEIASEGLEGIRFCFHDGTQKLHVRLPLLGRHSVHTALRAAAVGLVDGLSWGEILTGLEKGSSQLRLIVATGLRETMLLDDTYNASPASMLAALNLLEDIANHGRRAIAVLGEMLELGDYDEEGHRLVGGRAAQVVGKLIAVGPRARHIAEEALAAGMVPADVAHVASNEEAVALLLDMLSPGDVVLVKGSRALGMEKIVDRLSLPNGSEGRPHA